MESIKPEDRHKYISNETNPFKKLSKTMRTAMGVAIGFTTIAIANKSQRLAYLNRPHRHLLYMIGFGVLFYKSYDFNDYITKKDIYVLSIPQQRLREQEILKKQLEEINSNNK